MAWAGVGAALIGGAANLLGGAASNRFSARQAQLQRKWEENMANTAIQRRKADLEAAGFNPMLAFMGSGAGGLAASTPQGSSAQSVDMSNIGSSAVGQYLQAKQITSNMDLQASQRQANLAQAEKTDTERKIKEMSPDYRAWEKYADSINTGEKAAAVGPQAQADLDETLQRVKNLHLTGDTLQQNLEYNKELYPLMLEAQRISNKLQSAGVPEAQIMENMYKEHPWLRNLKWARDFIFGSGGAVSPYKPR